MKSPITGIYAIADFSVAGDRLLEKTEAILEAGISILQLRAKSLTVGRKARLAAELLRLCGAYRTPLIINDDVDLAAEIGAQGVHLGKSDPTIQYARNKLGEAAIIGVSCYREPERAANTRGADYVAFGRFFPSTTKPQAVQADPVILRRARQWTTLPVVAIGGITTHNAASLIEAGADALAVAAGLYLTNDARQTVMDFQKLFAR